MQNNDMQKYIDEMMRLYSKNPNAEKPSETETPPKEPDEEETPVSEEPTAAPQIPDLSNFPVLPLETITGDNLNTQAMPSNEDYTETGYLRVDVTSGEGAFPLEEAVVVITQKTPLGQSAVSITATDGNGRTPLISLPAPIISDSSEMNTPFSSYTAEIFLKGYHTVINDNVPIFANVTSILPVNLIPLPTNASNQREITFYSNEPQF